MDNGSIGVVQVEVTGYERIQRLVDELNVNLQAAQSALEALGRVELDIRPVTPSCGTQDRI